MENDVQIYKNTDDVDVSNLFWKNNDVDYSEFAYDVRNNYSKQIVNVNNKVLLDTLSPEVQHNEEAKRKHKQFLLIALSVFLGVQFLASALLSGLVIGFAYHNPESVNALNILVTFVAGYITSVVVELIAILSYIVKKVFDTSISELLALFKEKEN